MRDLEKLDNNFLLSIPKPLFQRLVEARENKIHCSELVLELAPHLEQFLATYFNIQMQVQEHKTKHTNLGEILKFKRNFIQRRSASIDPPKAKPLNVTNELEFAKIVMKKLDNEQDVSQELAYAAWATKTHEGRIYSKNGFLFKLPMPANSLDEAEVNYNPNRGFKHTDHGISLEYACDQAFYCVKCHKRNKDSCKTGIDEQHDGCPLRVKISEMNILKEAGYYISSLAVACIDNPLLAATGHRICNDCKLACIFQKQDPVDVPAIETQVLNQVLDLDWGFEIYALLTQWNPLNILSPLPTDKTDKSVLVVGQGPAGFTLAHYLLREGHTVVAIDGMKIEPLPDILLSPIKHIKEHWQELDLRIIAGFGGVSEYGITVRWDKNYLMLIRILLERQKRYSLFGNVRYEGTITSKDAFALGFNHIALCTGAGKPKTLDIKNSLAKGVRQASDFLMALQLTGASRENSIANLQIRSPMVVIGGGLTAIDAATEALAYYNVQTARFKFRYKELVKRYGLAKVRENWNKEDHEIADEFLSNSSPKVTLLYRKKIVASPAVKLNKHEVTKALEEGIIIEDNTQLLSINTDTYGHVESLAVRNESDIKIVSTKCVLVAIGTEQTTIENATSIFGDKDPKYAGNVVKAMASAKDGYKSLKFSGKHNPSIIEDCKTLLSSSIHKINRLTSDIVEVIVHSPLAAKNFKPGQFYRLQNFESLARVINNTTMSMESIALTGASVDKENGLISLIALEVGGSSDLCKFLEIGKPVALMGPTGSPSHIPKNKKVLLIGGGLGNAVLFSIGKAMRKNGCHVTYFAAYRDASCMFKQNEIEDAADQIVWCSENTFIECRRHQDKFFSGNVIEALKEIGPSDFEHLLVIGSAPMMNAVQMWHKNSPITAICSVNSPMQCMMQGVCGQCLHQQIDPATKLARLEFACINQDQELKSIDFENLSGRLEQNSVSEKITRLWIQHCLTSLQSND